ncbi:MAG: hypothetical protein VZS44_00990 [Bacilli bacterium]|nr:hypothetical protein [Bacilli bacterium]
MVKKILLVIGIIIVIICGGVGYYIYLMSVQENMLKQEIINYTNKDLINDEFVVEVKTKGNYAYIEEAIKKYYKKLSINVRKINLYLIDEDLEKLMTIDNLTNDRPKFDKSYKILEDTKTDIDLSISVVKELCDENYIKNLVSDKIKDKHFIDLYNSLMYTKSDIQELKDIREDTEELSNNLNLYLDKAREVFNILEKNDRYWSIDKGSIYITDENILNEYNKKYQELRDIVNNKLSKYKKRSIGKSNNNSVISA